VGPSALTRPLIRSAALADGPAVAELHVHAWRWAYRDLMPRAMLDALDIAERTALWIDSLSTPGTSLRLWLAERPAGDLVGFVASGNARDEEATAGTGEIYALYQNEASLRTGVGRALVEQAALDLRTREFTSAMVRVLEGNQRARGFFEHCGWATDGEPSFALFGEHKLGELRYRKKL
jgi:GNAT superfamily N-acetyltransferase